MQTVFYDTEDILSVLGEKKKIFVVHGKAYEGSKVERVLKRYETVEFTSFRPNPDLEDIKKGVELFNKENADLIVAVGGGSAIDVAKSIRLLHETGTELALDKLPKVECSVSMMAVPTTAGSGSEATAGAVIYKEDKKYSLAGKNTLPEYVLLEPEFLYTLSGFQKKCTLVDALCQAVESWWSKKANEESIEYSRKALTIIKEYYKEYLSIGNNKSDSNDEVFKQILMASNYSGRAINITATTAAHAMSYGITKRYGIPHGNAVGLCMLQVWNELRKRTEEVEYEEIVAVSRVLQEIESIISFEDYCSIWDELGLVRPEEKDPIKVADLLTETVNVDRLGNFPVKLDKNILHKMYERILCCEG